MLFLKKLLFQLEHIMRIRVNDSHKIVSREKITRQLLSIKLITSSLSLLVYFKLCTMTNPITMFYFAPIMIHKTKLLNLSGWSIKPIHECLSSNTNVTEPTSIKGTNSLLISQFSHVLENQIPLMFIHSPFFGRGRGEGEI